MGSKYDAVILFNAVHHEGFNYVLSPNEKWFGQPPDLGRLYIIDYTGLAIRAWDDRSKLDSRSTKYKFLGYASAVDATVLCLETMKLGTSRSISLDEDGMILSLKTDRPQLHCSSLIEEKNSDDKQSPNSQEEQSEENEEDAATHIVPVFSTSGVEGEL